MQLSYAANVENFILTAIESHDAWLIDLPNELLLKTKFFSCYLNKQWLKDNKINVPAYRIIRPKKKKAKRGVIGLFDYFISDNAQKDHL